MILIRQKGEVESLLLFKFFQAGDRIRADAQRDRFRLFKRLQRIPQTAGLNGAAGCHGLGIEIQHNVLFPPEVLQGNVVTVLIF